MATFAPERKVLAGTVGGGGGAIVGSFILYLLKSNVYHGKEAPAEVKDFVLFVVAAVAAFGLGWLAPHTPRPDDDPNALPPADHAADDVFDDDYETETDDEVGEGDPTPEPEVDQEPEPTVPVAGGSSVLVKDNPVETGAQA
jgi:hypothetical protein